MTWIEFVQAVRSDLFRYCGREDWPSLWRTYWFIPGFTYTFWMRLTGFLGSVSWLFPFYILSRLNLARLQVKYGICIPYNARIGNGLYIGHFGGIVVNYQTIIGKNCNLNHGVTIGETYGGKTPGTPTIGDNVYIGPGSFLIGGILVGDHVAIGANTVVTKSLPDKAVVVGGPSEIISSHGSGSYVVNTIPSVGKGFERECQ